VDSDLFGRALGLQAPWRVEGVEFDEAARRLNLTLGFARGTRFECSECDRADCKVHDVSEKTWRHLDFFEHQAFLTARVPRVECPEHGVHLVALPWARPGSGFTLLFEALTMALCAQMPVRAVADLVGEHDTRVWRIVHHYVDQAREREDLSGVSRIGIETVPAYCAWRQRYVRLVGRHASVSSVAWAALDGLVRAASAGRAALYL
jgi:transposase